MIILKIQNSKLKNTISFFVTNIKSDKFQNCKYVFGPNHFNIFAPGWDEMPVGFKLMDRYELFLVKYQAANQEELGYTTVLKEFFAVEALNRELNSGESEGLVQESKAMSVEGAAGQWALTPCRRRMRQVQHRLLPAMQNKLDYRDRHDALFIGRGPQPFEVVQEFWDELSFSEQLDSFRKVYGLSQEDIPGGVKDLAERVLHKCHNGAMDIAKFSEPDRDQERKRWNDLALGRKYQFASALRTARDDLSYNYLDGADYDADRDPETVQNERAEKEAAVMRKCFEVEVFTEKNICSQDIMTFGEAQRHRERWASLSLEQRCSEYDALSEVDDLQAAYAGLLDDHHGR